MSRRIEHDVNQACALDDISGVRVIGIDETSVTSTGQAGGPQLQDGDELLPEHPLQRVVPLAEALSTQRR